MTDRLKQVAMHPFHPRQNMCGMAYLGLLILLAIMGVVAMAGIQLGSILQRREAEQELLDIGKEFQLALISYDKATPVGMSRSPQSIQDLLKDPRFPASKHHLRRLYPDPITGKPDWGLLMAADGSGIIGIYSLSTSAPIKIANFDPEFQYFEGSRSYRDWVFMIIRPQGSPLVQPLKR